jgi:hypothetical protein
MFIQRQKSRMFPGTIVMPLTRGCVLRAQIGAFLCIAWHLRTAAQIMIPQTQIS